MQTVDKAMRLLGYFTPAQPEIGLSELARAATLDKAATRRFLVALAKHGFIEQNPATKQYRLGSAFLRFARIREATFPLSSIVQPALERLATFTGETAHASIASGPALVTIAVAEPQRATRVYVDPAQLLPLHATASGLAYLAFAAKDVRDAFLADGNLVKHTEKTPASTEKLRKVLETVSENGFSIGERSFEDEVIGIASPIFDWSGAAFGAIAVASVASRFTPKTRTEISAAVLNTAIEITRATGAEPHRALIGAAARTGERQTG